MTAELTFEQSYPASSRIAAVQATRIARRNSLPADFIDDLAQEGLLALWRGTPAFDERRAIARPHRRSVAKGVASRAPGHFWGRPTGPGAPPQGRRMVLRRRAR